MKKAQGSLEYLIIIAAVLAVAAIVVLFLTGSFGSTSKAADIAQCKEAASRCSVERATSQDPPCSYCETDCPEEFVDLCKKGLVKNIYEGYEPEENGDGFVCVPVECGSTSVCEYYSCVSNECVLNNVVCDEGFECVNNECVEIEEENQPPVLTEGYVQPSSGDRLTTFIYKVLYKDADNDAPSYVNVSIDGVMHSMSKDASCPPASSYSSGCTYHYDINLAAGNHIYFFVASDGNAAARLPSSGTFSGPIVLGVIASFCGNGFVELGEECDSGGVDTAGCVGSTCLWSFCGDGYVNLVAGEDCDGVNLGGYTDCTDIGYSSAGTLACKADCMDYDTSGCASTCGDGLVEPGEGCDDGNIINDDGCSSSCSVETGWTCTGQPSECTLTTTGNLLVNGDFSQGEEGWSTTQEWSGGSLVSFSFTGGVGRIYGSTGGGKGTIYQEISVDIESASTAVLNYMVKPDSQSLDCREYGGCSASYPTIIEVHYLDSGGAVKCYKQAYGYYQKGTQICQNLVTRSQWVSGTINLKEVSSPQIATLTKIVLVSAGWDIDGSFDNIELLVS